MRVDILAIGSRGDVQPYVALGIGMQKAGFQVRLVTLEGFDDLVSGYGLDHIAIAPSPRSLAGTEAGQDWTRERNKTAGFVGGLVRVAASVVEEGMANYWRACNGVEAIIVSGLASLVGFHIAERLGVPLIRTELSPFARTRYDWAGNRNFGTIIRGDWREVQAAIFRNAIWLLLRSRINTARQDILALPPLPWKEPFSALDHRHVPMLDAYSSTVVQKPPDWGDWIHVTGFWFLEDDAAWTPPAELTSFLDDGPAPVFVGFGSTPFPSPEASTQVIVRALKAAGQRGVLLAGGSGLGTGRLADHVLSLGAVPHNWLFSRVSAAVHHGGAGVTGAALRAGLPAVVVPVFADQPFWGRRIQALGAGPRPIPAKKLTEDSLASAIRATEDATMRERASELGRCLRSEDGVGNAVNAIEQSLQPSTSRAISFGELAWHAPSR